MKYGGYHPNKDFHIKNEGRFLGIVKVSENRSKYQANKKQN